MPTVINKVTDKKIKDIVSFIASEYEPEKIILFGSYATGNYSKSSDIDLLIITKTKESSWETSVDISSKISHTFPIDIIVKSPTEINLRIKSGDFFIKEIIEGGKVVYEKTCQ